MSLTLVFALALPTLLGQSGSLEIANPRATLGYLGATHPKVNGRLPGDTVYFTFDIRNLKLDDTGRASYALLVEVFDEKNRPIFKLGPQNAIAQNYLGGNSMPCSAHLDIPVDSDPGTYLFRITVTDRLTEQKVVFERKGKILPRDFGLVHVATFADRDGKVPVAPVNVVGASLYVRFATVGFERDKKTDAPDVAVSLRVLDSKGDPTLAKPLIGAINKDVADDLKIIPMQFTLTLNRPGDFTIELTATDRVSGKTATQKIPLKVLAGS